MNDDTPTTGLEMRINDLEKELHALRSDLSQARLEQWEGRIDDLEVQAHLGSMELNERAEPILETLRERWLDAKEQIDSASTTANDVFAILRKGCDQSFRDFKNAVINAKATVTS